MAKVFFKLSFLKLHEIDVSHYNKFQYIIQPYTEIRIENKTKIPKN